MLNQKDLEKIRESLSLMISYVEDELLDKYDENDDIYKDTERANEILDFIYELSIYDKGYEYITNKNIEELKKKYNI